MRSFEAAKTVADKAHAPIKQEPGTDRLRYLWLGVGTVLSLFAVHGRWDVPLAAWLFSVFLLRFTRVSRPLVGLGLVWLVSALGGVWWLWQVAVPMNVVTVLGAVALSSVLVVPYVLDRMFAPGLGTVGGLLLFPAALAAGQFLIAVVSPFGTAYGLLAATQHDNLPLLQVISLTGPYGIGFLIGWLATVVNRVWENPVPWHKTRFVVGAYVAVLAIVLIGGGARLAFFPPDAEGVRVAGVSPDRVAVTGMQRMLGGTSGGVVDAGSAAQEFGVIDAQGVSREDPASVRAAFETNNTDPLSETRQAARAGAKIVVWSEQTAQVLASDKRAFLADAASIAREEGIYLQVAYNVYLPEAPFLKNQTSMIDPNGEVVWTYDKARPIPGLENYPAGDGVVPVVETPYGRLATVTCFDADFPALARVDADIMIVPARDWTEIGRVHSQKANLRAVENGYSIIRPAQHGVSTAVDPQGRVLSAQDYDKTEDPTMISDVPTRGAPTIYGLIGDAFAWLSIAGTVLLIGTSLVRQRSQRPGTREGM